MFRKHDGSTVGSQLFFCNLLVSCCFFAGSLCDITTFSLESGSESVPGASVNLICTYSYTGVISIFKSEGRTPADTAWSRCDQTNCVNLNPNYTVTTTGHSVKITIKSLQRAADQKWWTCRTTTSNQQLSEKQLYLTVYTLPSSIRLNGPAQTCDLGQSTCSYKCTTDQCTYPSPNFSWLYVFDDGTTAQIAHITSVNGESNGCADSSKIYGHTKIFQRYQLYSGNTQKTVRLQCYLTITGLTSVRRTSGVSQDMIFAVKVSTVHISDGNNELTGNSLIVVSKEEKSLKCIPGYGNPTPTVEWFIGTARVSTEEEFRFIPDNSHHGQQIYCVADNIPNNGRDIVSNKPVLYVKVKIEFVYIEPAADTVISVIEDTPEPAVCRTSAGRPGSTIKWYRNNEEQGEDDSTDFEITYNNLNVTKSTRYIRVLRPDSGWTLSCSASNFEGASPIWANNSKQLNVLYPPEHMNLLIAGNPVVGPVVNVIKGTTKTLKCTASSNPPSNVFSWNINSIDGDTLTIDDNIQNGQIVNCTARNVMTSTAGITVNGYGSISKKINRQYGAFIERIVVNGNADPTLIIEEKSPILIACYVDSNPDSTISLFQGDTLLMEKQQSVVLSYNISSAKCSHTSKYICKAANGIDSVQEPAMKIVEINVKCSPRLAFNTESSVFAQENTSAVLSVTVLAYPIPTEYGWQKYTSNKWDELSNNTSTQMTNASLQYNLTIWSVKPKDYGQYKLTVDNTLGDPFSFTFILKAQGEPEPQTHKADDGSTAMAGIIGGVVGGLLLVCVMVIVVCILRRRNSLDDIKTKLFGRKSSASREEIQPQETEYSYAAVQKPTGGTSLNVIDSTSKAAPETTKEGPCYENPTLLTESDAKAKPQKKRKPAKQKDKKPVSQSHDGLQYVELSFSDTKKQGKKTKPAQPKADERTVYDAVQFGVVGAAYTSNGEGNDSKTDTG